MKIIVNGKYGATVGNLQVFTTEGAENAYRTFCRVCLKNLTLESSVVLSRVADDMKKLGFTPSQLEDIEIEVLKSFA